MLPMQVTHLLTLSVVTSPALAGVVTFAIPSSAPPGSGVLDATPVALSFEFPSFPRYFNLINTWNCIGNLQKVAGIWPAIRTGGTPQDEATYVPDLAVPIEYHEISFSVIPSNFSRKYLEVAAGYPGQVTIGLNRGANNITNTIEAATDAARIIDNLYALELGNEPDTFPYFGFPVAPANFSEWTPAAEAASEAKWQIAVGSAINRTAIIQAGNHYIPPPTFGAAMLLANEDPSALPYIRSFSHHNYPQSVVSSNLTSPPNLPALMSHANVTKNVEQYIADAAAAVEAGYPYVLGETNSISGGGHPTISPTFGAALWTLDYVLQAASINISRTYFHQGTIGGSNYVWWTPDGVRSPYYGAYAATTTLAGGHFLARLDTGADNYAGYAVFGPDGKPLRATLVNSDYFDGNSTRLEQTFSLTGLECGLVRVRRLTATSSLDRQDEGQVPSFAGRTFLDEGCTVNGEEMVEMVEVIDGVAEVTLLASEAVIVDL